MPALVLLKGEALIPGAALIWLGLAAVVVLVVALSAVLLAPAR